MIQQKMETTMSLSFAAREKVTFDHPPHFFGFMKPTLVTPAVIASLSSQSSEGGLKTGAVKSSFGLKGSPGGAG